MSNKKSKVMYDNGEWNFNKIDTVYKEIEKIALDELKLDCYENQIEIISSEQMIDAYTSIGMPIMYNHWSFGKQFVKEYGNYKAGRSGLAYEIVINSDPCISYLMEENTMTMQTLVIAHAAFGHNFFFKNNYLFKDWTDASNIIPYLSFAKKYVRDCEERYGEREVEMILNSAHALQNYGVNRYKRPEKLSIHKEKLRQAERENFIQSQVHHLWDKLTHAEKEVAKKELSRGVLKSDEENILYFVEKNSPVLDPWQRELIRIVRKVAQYFYPQAQTKLMNEGTATYVHYYIMNRLYDKGLINDGHMQEFLVSHCGVVKQPKFDETVLVRGPDGKPKPINIYNGINPYALGFDMFRDIERICKNPTDEDKEYFPDIAGADWISTFHWAVKEFRDESFVKQFLSPRLMRKWRMFAMEDDADESHYKISAIHNDAGYRDIKDKLSTHYTIANYYPEIKITDVDLRGNRTLHLTHKCHNSVELRKDTVEPVIKHLFRLWGHNIVLKSYNADDDSLIEEFSTEIEEY